MSNNDPKFLKFTQKIIADQAKSAYEQTDLDYEQTKLSLRSHENGFNDVFGYNIDSNKSNPRSHDPKNDLNSLREELMQKARVEFTSFDSSPLWQKIQAMRQLSETFGIQDPFFKCFSNVHGAFATINNGKKLINYSSYNYLGFNDRSEVKEAVCKAVEQYGTSVGASRIVAGERTFYHELEQKIASLYHKEDAIVFVSGHATNVSVISTLFGTRDLIVFDTLDHNSIIEGIKRSGAKYFSYAHNDLAMLRAILENHRHEYERVLIVTEGLFSMDGDLANLPELVAIKKLYGCFLMLDEAHALGVIGKRGLGSFEYWNEIERQDAQDFYEPFLVQKEQNAQKEQYDYSEEVDLWMGTLSKALASCGGYIAANKQIISMLRFNAPGFVFSVGLSAPMCQAAISSLELLLKEPNKVANLQENAHLFMKLAQINHLNVGKTAGFAVIPIMVGGSHTAVMLSNSLLEKGINVQPIIPPAVEEQQARLRFFITSEHTAEQIVYTIKTLVESEELGGNEFKTFDKEPMLRNKFLEQTNREINHEI